MTTSNLEKYASEAYKLVLANEQDNNAETYAGEAFKRSTQAGAALGTGAHLYDVSAKGIKFSGGTLLRRGAATAALFGLVGGLGGGAIKRTEVNGYE